MRSDRNPYFLLKNTKDVRLKALFTKAEEMSVAEINALNIKPDWKRALLFLNTMGQRERSLTNAEALADLMMNSTTSETQHFEIWQYQGGPVWLLVNRTSIELVCNDYFIKDKEKIYCNNNWIDLNRNKTVSVMQSSVFVTLGTHHTLSQMRNDALRAKYATGLR